LNINGVNHFLCGCALGFDMVAAELIIELKQTKNITLEIVLPFKEQDKHYTKEQKKRYAGIISKADKVTVISEKYGRSSYTKRNRYMVDNSSLVIALYDDNVCKGEILSMLLYAQQKRIEIITISPEKDPKEVYGHF